MRLEKYYPHINAKEFNKGGTKYIVCYGILKQKSKLTTTKGCITCGVPLCSANSKKLKEATESCEYRWHNTFDLSTLKIVSKIITNNSNNQTEKSGKNETEQDEINETEQDTNKSQKDQSKKRKRKKKGYVMTSLCRSKRKRQN